MDDRGKGQAVNGSSNMNPETKQKACCPSCTRIMIAIAIFFMITTIIAVAVLAWREIRLREDKYLTRSTLRKAYPGYFRSREEQKEFERDITGPVPAAKLLNSSLRYCSVFCKKVGSTNRKRRAVSSNTVLHGCCESNSYFDTPDTKDNIVGVTRTLVHLTDARQFFHTETCEQADGCTGCNCMLQSEINTAVVFKPGKSLTDDSDLDDVEIDLFYFGGCCKCVNT